MKAQKAIVASVWGIVALLGIFVLHQTIVGDPSGDKRIGICVALVPPAIACYLALQSMREIPFIIRLVAVILGAAMLGFLELMLLGATDCGPAGGAYGGPPGSWCALLD